MDPGDVDRVCVCWQRLGGIAQTLGLAAAISEERMSHWRSFFFVNIRRKERWDVY